MIVITGATGNIGRSLVQALVTAGEPATAVSRKEAAFPAGVRHQRTDFTEPGSLDLTGAKALFLVPPGGWYDAAGILEAARANGVRRVVLVSSQGVGTKRHPAILEQAVQDSGLEWTVLRPSGFHSNTFAWSQSVREQRLVEAPFGDISLPAIDPGDIADVAATALCDPGHAGKTWELTGPAPISPRQQSQVIAAALGEPVRFAELSREEARVRLLRFMPEHVADSTLGILGSPTAAEQQVSADVERVLGRPARPYADWVARNIAAFR
ncbi:NmrA family protein [Kribbella flavida DSM 17836]|uniref:NmrA family protein n=1 Tax=Kribbella flavida (strain DSM 17836 / JCM 10339 / NBRC 14399) TaxID=479435 RepID=D2PV65_KRIFD|nr:NmrA family protein [Kribbella flavida DSM 17836]